MWFIPSLRAFTSSPKPRPVPHRKRPATVLTLEPLEDRCLLSFGTGGFVTSTPHGYGQWGFLQPDGKMVFTGQVEKLPKSYDSDFFVTRLNPDGSPDSSFGSAGTTTVDFSRYSEGSKYAALQPDGKIVIAGSSTRQYKTQPEWDFATLRFTASGALDKSLGKTGESIIQFGPIDHSTALGILIQPWDQKVLVVGYASPGTPGHIGLVRYNVDGTLDASFGSGGVETMGSSGEAVGGVAAHQGKILVASTLSGGQGIVLSRFNQDGSWDTSWGTNGRIVLPLLPGTLTNGASRVLVLPDDRIVVSGIAHEVSGADDVLLIRYNPDGSLDTSFGGGAGYTLNQSLFTNGAPEDGGVSGLARQADGKLIVAGATHSYNLSRNDWDDQGYLLRYNAEGTVDTTFGTNGVVQTVYGGRSSLWKVVMVQPDGQLVAGGAYYSATSSTLLGMVVARFNPDGSLDAGAPLLAAGGPVSDHPSTQLLTQAGLQPLVQEAVARWQAVGLSAPQVETLQHADIRIANLGGSYLGLESGNSILIDDNAAGYGWFVDPTPHDDSEFTTPGDQGEQNHMDLLTALMHEMGHVLGLDHDADGVMQDTLTTGTRRTPTAAEAAEVTSAVSGATAPVVLSTGARDSFFAHLADVTAPDWEVSLAIALALDPAHRAG